MSAETDPLRAALPGYEISGELGRGGWGVVYAAEHRALERRVAVKALPSSFGADPANRARFRSEARVVAKLDHPHIVPLFDFVERDDLCLFVMELMPGGTLWDQYSADTVSQETACAVALAMLTALGHAHERGIFHRDIKPDNVLFNSAGVPKLADFGIAKVLDQSSTMRTATGVIMGTPAYMAPEQGAGQPVTQATDLYSIGVMLYELLSGRLPFDTEGGAMSLLYRHSHEPPQPIRQISPGVPNQIAEVVMAALEKTPEDRPESAIAFAATLDRAASSSLGSDWLTRSGVPVLASKDVFDTGGVPVAAAEPDLRPPPPTTPPPTTPPPPPATPEHVTADQVAPSAERAPGPARRRPALWLAAAAVVLVVAAAAGVLMLGGGDDPSEEAAGEPLEVSREAEARFRDACRANDVGDELCSCALDRSLVRLTPQEFLANDRLLQETGDKLTAEVIAIFDECVEDLDPS